MNSQRAFKTIAVLSLGLAISLVVAGRAHPLPGASSKSSRAGLSANERTQLWKGSHFTEADRHRAVIRGLEFIYRNARNSRNFARYGSDYLWCFYTISASVNDDAVRRRAQEMGVERAQRWRELHDHVPRDVDAGTLIDLAFGSDAADSLGVRDHGIKKEIQEAARRFGVNDFMPFDAVNEPPPADVPDACPFDNTMSARGSRRCQRCGRKLHLRSRYDVWCEALVTAYTGEHYGVRLGADYQDVIKWLPALRPYPQPRLRSNDDFIQSVYAVTHIVYTLNDYDQYRLPPELLSDEYQFLKRNLREAIAERDQDMLGEFVDSLKSLGLTEDDVNIRRAIDYLLAHQNRDGSWGDQSARDNYERYHPTWNGIVALSNYGWRGDGPDPARTEMLKNLNRRIAPGN